MLVEQMVTSLSEIDTVDHYHEALKKLIESKIKGKKVVEFEVEEVPRLDIMSALKKSLQQSSRKPMVKATPRQRRRKRLLWSSRRQNQRQPRSERRRELVTQTVSLLIVRSDWLYRTVRN